MTATTLLLLASLGAAWAQDEDPRITPDEAGDPAEGKEVLDADAKPEKKVLAAEAPEKQVLDEEAPEPVVLDEDAPDDDAIIDSPGVEELGPEGAAEEDDEEGGMLLPATAPASPAVDDTDTLTLETMTKDPVVRAYEVAKAAYEREDWAGALDRARKVLVLDDDHVGARVIEAGSLHRLRQWEEAMEGFHALADDPGAGEDARRMIGLYDNRWRRDQVSLSLGGTFRDDHAVEGKQWTPGFVAELEAPIAGPVNVRFDFASGWETRGQLGVQGPIVAALITAHQPIGIWALDAGVGPGIWLGRSQYWNSAYTGPFPAYRAAAGASVRPLRNLGFRAELGHSGGWGTKTLLSGFSAGVDARLMVTGYVR